MAGTGVAVRRDVEAGRDQLHLVIIIAVDASPGWRDLELSFGQERRRLSSVFQILGLASSGGRSEWPGIGGHLI